MVTYEILVVRGEETANYHCLRGYNILASWDYHFVDASTELHYYLIKDEHRIFFNRKTYIERANSSLESFSERARAYSDYYKAKELRELEFLKKKGYKLARDEKMRKSKKYLEK